MTLLEKMTETVSRNYPVAEYPCLHEQLERFSVDQPFLGKRLLYAAPLTCNTQVALLPVIAGGAELTVSWPSIVKPDMEVVTLLKSEGIACYERVPDALGFDVILDCCGQHSSLRAEAGYVELTRSGLAHYRNLKGNTCIDVDSTLVKQIETVLGTGDGLLRALRQDGFNDLVGRKVVLFGYGKVGKGICRSLMAEKAKVVVVELQNDLSLPGTVRYVSGKQSEAVLNEVKEADFMITATGLAHVIQDNYPVDAFLKTKATLINMGGEDEYGDQFPEDRVLNQKNTYNFILEEPTGMRFIDPVFALFNESAELLLSQPWGEGIRQPPEVLVHSLVDSFCREHGVSIDAFG